jgi:hypothetical protein
MGRFVRPQTVVLKISDGDTITVKKRLCTGEQRAAYARMYLAGPDGQLRKNQLQGGIALVVAYLVDWHGQGFTDDQGEPIVIRGLTMEELERTLDTLDPDSFGEIVAAVRAHEAAVAAAIEQEKKLTTGTAGDAPISPSPSALVGVSTG